uniref:14.4 kDa salivary protein n=1 Tax=Phlebotomus duboscqi TaxID=37738 RepID=Q06K44_PHLDU|nr:14.4 kDa salivary protein [Phlebotomus duboscqi]
MKYLVLCLISAVFLIGICQADIPSRKCRELYKTKQIDEECILHCEYVAYGFTNMKFDIENEHIYKYMAVLMKAKILNDSNRKKFETMFKNCKKRAFAKYSKRSCKTITDYYECIVYYTDDDLIIDGKFANAIIAFDKTVKV